MTSNGSPGRRWPARALGALCVAASLCLSACGVPEWQMPVGVWRIEDVEAYVRTVVDERRQELAARGETPRRGGCADRDPVDSDEAYFQTLAACVRKCMEESRVYFVPGGTYVTSDSDRRESGRAKWRLNDSGTSVAVLARVNGEERAVLHFRIDGGRLFLLRRDAEFEMRQD